MEFFGLDGRELADDVQKGVEENWLGLFLCGPDAFAILDDVSFERLQ